MSKAGYEYLLAYKITVSIYDLTKQFCDKYIDPKSRTHDQMVQAARSGMQNIAEGHKHVSLKGYIYLTGIAMGSLEELLNDYLSYARQNNISILSATEAKTQIREIRAIWDIIRANPYLPNLPDSPYLAVNLMLTLVNQANYLIGKLNTSLQEKHMKEGGLTERLYRKRIEYRSRNN